jgi:antitoxin (DNA-binding transcriptional repressor) of toxin-antitoxin stability system
MDRVEAGETLIIVRNGVPVAEVRPVRRVSPEDVVKRIRAIAKRLSKRNAQKTAWPKGGQSVRKIAHERHRY